MTVGVIMSIPPSVTAGLGAENGREVSVMIDLAENSQALRDSVRAGFELVEAQAAGASPTVLAELLKVRSSADARVDSLRRRVG